MTSLILTSIYSRLYGTEYGGRPNRDIHYKYSLLNILNIKPTKVVCFTSREELEGLCDFFYEQNSIDKEKLQFIVFDLSSSKYFDKIHAKKDLDSMLTFDRCYEIQYNKFFWFDLIEDRFNYDRVYWIDAGLSHAGLFPDEFVIKEKHRYFSFNLFNPELLEKLNIKTTDKVLLLSKNNTGGLFWSGGLPRHYYDEFDISRHIVGGMFGGTPKNYDKLKNMFTTLLETLLEKEDNLYMEEVIMSCLYFNNQSMFTPLEFDDWYVRDFHKEGEYSYFYQIFL